MPISYPRSQIRLHAITGSIADISAVASNKAAQPASTIDSENLHDILSHVAGAISRIHGSGSFTEATAGTFSHAETVFTGDVKVKGGDVKTDASIASIFDTTADTILIGGDAELIQIGANNGLSEFAGDARVSGSIEMVGSGMELIDRVGGALKIRGGDLTGSVGKVTVDLSGSELQMKDGYALDGGWSGAISLADSSTDWSRFKSVFGEASILSAIATAAALPADARFLYKVMNAESGVTALSGSQLRQVDGTYFSSSFAAVPAASRNENVDVFLNGQLLVSKSYNSGDYDYDIAADGTSVSFNFGLQPDDFVSILVPVTVASIADYVTANGAAGGGGAAGATGATGAQGAQGATGATGAQGAQGATGATGAQGAAGSSDLDGLTDVAITSPSSGQVLKYNGSSWVNDTDAGGAIAVETMSVVASALTGVVAIDTATNKVHYYTVNASANWTPNIRSTSSASLNSAMSVGDSMTVTIMATQGTGGFFASNLQIDGAAITPKWAGGLSPSFGNEYAVDIYSYTIVKTASATFTVFASVSPFA